MFAASNYAKASRKTQLDTG